VIGIALIAIGVAASPFISLKLGIVVGIYLASSVAYQLWLKFEPVVDMGLVASGFVLRAIAGAVAVGVPISQWFLIVATFGSLFMVSGKRLADARTAAAASAESGAETRPPSSRRVRPAYGVAFLQSILVMSLSVTIAAYCLWAFENVKATAGHAALCYQLSIVPFTLAMMRYGFLVEQGHGGSPEEVALGDRVLGVLAILWAVTFAIGVYL
jgi:decaprenyl-phosphate phosphoribosyltransferase